MESHFHVVILVPTTSIKDCQVGLRTFYNSSQLDGHHLERRHQIGRKTDGNNPPSHKAGNDWGEISSNITPIDPILCNVAMMCCIYMT